jgi:hypothetical protein
MHRYFLSAYSICIPLKSQKPTYWTNRSWRYLQIWCFRRGSHCEIFQSVCNARKKRCVLGQNLTGYGLKCTLYPNICNKTPENYTQIYAVRKLVPKCAYLSRTEIEMISISPLRCRNLEFLLFRLCVFAFTISRFNFVFQNVSTFSGFRLSLIRVFFFASSQAGRWPSGQGAAH